MTSYFLGMMGYAYQAWQGVFYAGGVSAPRYLAHYSHVFNAVELDSTFYGAARASTEHQIEPAA